MTMHKDVIYVDVEDDVTDIVGKIKASKEAIVALVPPKRIGALQSVVNLKLLVRIAKEHKKHVVIIGSNPALEPLAALAKIPIAKTLQSRPMIPTIDDGQSGNEIDVIEGGKISVGELASTKKRREDDDVNDEIIDAVSLEDDESDKQDVKKRSVSKKNVPDFNVFRKRVFIVGTLVIMLAGFFVWATMFAPAAIITVTARTTQENVAEGITLVTDTKKVDKDAGVLLLRKKEIVKTSEVEFTPTGTKKVGDKAKGKITLKRTAFGTAQITVPIGTEFVSGDLMFVSTESVVIEGSYMGLEGVIMPSPVDIAVQAAEFGETHNVPEQNYSASVSGFTSEGSAMTGGTSRTIKVATQADFDKAKEGLKESLQSEAKEELFRVVEGEGIVVIEASFDYTAKDPEVSPKIGEEVKTDKAKITAKTTYTVSGVDRDQIEEFLNKKLGDKVEKEADRKVYDNGISRVFLDSYINQDKTITATVKTTAKVGPEIDEMRVRDAARGNRYGEVQRKIESINGVRGVDIRFSYFWVQTVPEDDDKVTINIEISE
jgi:hypothetical protein